MHVDDRLATVLAASATGENQVRVQFRQLLDLIGTSPADARSPTLDAAMLRLAELSRRIPPQERAEAVARSGVRLRNPRLVAELAGDHPAVSAAAIGVAQLTDEQWLDILPALPPIGRGLLRRRGDLGSELSARLVQLGAGDVPLPEPASAISTAPPAVETGAKVLPLRARGEAPVAAGAPPAAGEPAPASPEPMEGSPAGRDGIGAIVRRIEEFRRSRDSAAAPANDAPLLPLGDEAQAARLEAFAFACDATGRIGWTDATISGMIVSLLLPLADPAAEGLAATFRRRGAIRRVSVTLAGAAPVAGDWLVDALPEFDHSGRFVGYAGKFRRPPAPISAAQANPEAVRLRQVLHELRTPVNAIQGFAEMIHQQLVGSVPHTYRALAAAVAADAAQMLAGFDELDRLARLDSAAATIEPGEADLGATAASLIAQLEPFTTPRGSGFSLVAAHAGSMVAIAPAEAERLGWRLLATLAGAAHPGEILAAVVSPAGAFATLTVTLPEALAQLPDPSAPALPSAPAPTLSGGAFGPAFALRLAAAEARAAGGRLVLDQGRAVLSLPAAQAEQAPQGTDRPNPTDVSASSSAG